MDERTKAALERARAVLAETAEVEHDHTGPEACPRCGGEPPEPPPLTSFHPVQQRIDSNEESSE